MNSKPGMANFLAADLYGLTASEFSPGRSNPETAKLMIQAGIKVIQYREKELPLRQMYIECMKIREMTRKAGVTFIVNDHIDIALLADADGVHIGQDDLPPEQVRKLIGGKMLLGLSTHSPSQAQTAVSSGVIDYIGVGPLFSTQTKKHVCAPVGLEYLDYVVQNISLPFVAIGGIKAHNIAEVKKHGAHTIALVSEIVGAVDIPQKINEIRELLNTINL